MKPVYGKYRAIVTNVNDPECMGRVTVSCPKLFGDTESNWCFICVPFAGNTTGFFFTPSVGDLVWLEFEGGDTRYPIVSGGWFKSKSSPISNYPYDPKRYRIKTPKGHVLELSDVDGEEVIKIWAVDNTLVEVGMGGVTITGNVTVNGAISASGSVSAPNIK